MECYVIGIDIAKNSFELCGMNRLGRVVKRKKLSRGELLEYVSTHRFELIAMEACAGAHYWGRRFEELGHEVRLIPAQYVKPYVKRNKNDQADAEAIAEASLRPTMNFVGVKSVQQQDMQIRHRVRERLVKARTALANEIRGFLGEFGIVVPQGISRIRSGLFELIEHQPGDLSVAGKALIEELLEEFHKIDKEVGKQEAVIKAEAKSSV